MYKNNLVVKSESMAHMSVQVSDREFRVDMSKLFRNIDTGDGFSKKSPISLLISQMGYKGITVARDFTKDLGITPSNLLKILRGTLYNERIVPVEYWVEKLARGYNKGAYKWHIIDKIHNNIDSIKSLEKDNLHHLVPIAIMLNCTSTQDMRKFFGKSMWKNICGNSLTRNTLIFKCYQNNPSRDRTIIDMINSLPSSILKYSPSVVGKCITYPELHHHCLNIIRSKRVSVDTDRYDLIRDIDYLRDTVRLYRRVYDVGHVEAVNVLARRSTKNVLALHDTLVQEGMSRRKPSKDIEWVSKYDGVDTNVKDYTFTIYNTTGDIVREGVDMRHCVGCYSDSVLNNNYLVISVRRGGKKVSTLGCKVVEGELKFNQHYKAMNKHVGKELEGVANTIIYRLNNHRRHTNEI